MGVDRNLLIRTPHPDYGGCTTKEVSEDVQRIEEDLIFAKANDVDPVFISWLEDELAGFVTQ